jgi:tRNA threonylcarbamoyladenosine biosynthesis protein TsaB
VILLSIDTCDSQGSVCVVRDGHPGEPRVHDSAEDYSSWLIPTMQAAVEEAGISFRELDAFAVASGPGSFTGVRVGLTTVKGFAEVYGRPIAAVSRLLALASLGSDSADWIASTADAGRGELYAALYRRKDGSLLLQGEECVSSPGEFLSAVAEAVPGGGVLWVSASPKLISGEPGWSMREQLGDRMEAVSPFLAPAIGRIGYQQVLEGKSVDALGLDANYVRRSDAERFWKDARRGRHGS